MPKPTPTYRACNFIQLVSSCGTRVFYGLNPPYSPGGYAPGDLSDYYSLAALKRVDTPAQGAYIASTSSQQREAEQALRESGWTALCSYHNPNSGNLITLWALCAQASRKLTIHAQAAPAAVAPKPTPVKRAPVKRVAPKKAKLA